MFKRRPEPRKKKEYISVSPPEVDLLAGKTRDEELRNEILKDLGLLEN